MTGRRYDTFVLILFAQTPPTAGSCGIRITHIREHDWPIGSVQTV